MWAMYVVPAVCKAGAGWKQSLNRSDPASGMVNSASTPVLGMIVLVIYAYETHPFSQRGRFMFIDEGTELEISNEAFPAIMAELRKKIVPHNHPDHVVVEQVARDLLAVTGPVRDWELFVVDDDSTVNAFVLPAGKIFVFTGLLKFVPSVDALAAVMGHEFAHVLSRHTSEQMGVAYLTTLFWDLVHSMLYTFTLNLPLFADLAGRGVDSSKDLLTSLPHSRMCEAEADVIGLYLMAMAGYDPTAAVNLWKQFSEQTMEEELEFFSDHPLHANRAKELSTHLNSAKEIYTARQKVAMRFEELRQETLKGHAEEAEAVRHAGIGEQGWRSIEELDRALFTVLSEHLVHKPFWYNGDKEEEEMVEESLKLTELNGKKEYAGEVSPSLAKAVVVGV
ncbi:hypothetical protein HK104_009576 [Borealophlyctis nickersoniae]|nr:hypothetical protein HK104_009576 [Borealophlyctis nickersoniae]